MADKTDKPEKAKRSEKADHGASGGEQQQKRKKAPAAPEASAEPKKPREPEPKIPARMRLKYEAEIVPVLMRELKIENKMRVPRLSKIVINMGLGEARDNIKLLEAAAEELTVISGQKPIMTKARKAISNFKLRENV